MKRITFNINKKGDVKVVDASGYGHGCQEATQEIEKLLGVVDEQSRGTTENYYQEVDPLVLKNEA